MRLDRNSAPVVGDAEKPVRLECHVDERSVAGDRLVHGVVQHLGKEMMQGRLVGAADIHAGAAADRLKPFEDLDRGSRIPGLARRDAARAIGLAGRRLLACRIAEEIAVICHFEVSGE